MCGHLLATKTLLDLGADPNVYDSSGKTALYQAVDNSQAKLVKILISNKADPNILQTGNKYVDGNSPLHQAVIKRDEIIVMVLLKYEANSNIQNSLNGKSPLHYAVEQSDSKIIKILLKYNSDPKIKDFSGISPMDIAKSEIKALLARTSHSHAESEKSTLNLSLFLPTPETVEAIPSIPLESFTTLNLSPVSNNGSFKLFENSEKQSCVVTTTFLDPESEKYINDGRLSKAFSFGGNASQLFN